MKRLFLLIVLCVTLLVSSCADINSEKFKANSEVTGVENKNDISSIEPTPAPSVTATPAITKIIEKGTDTTDKNDYIKNIKQYNGHFYTGKAVVLTYHHISSKPFSSITITPKRFENDLMLLKKNGFNVISLTKLINCMQGSDTLPENAVVITFDDGIESFYKYAFPLLKKYNMPAVNFIITSRTESYSPSSEDFNPLSPDEIKEMYGSGLVDIQSHTDNCHDYVIINDKLQKGGRLAYRIYSPISNTYESKEDYNIRVLKDLKKSSEIVFKYTGTYPQMLCFPFGHYNKNVVELARQCGYKYFITTQAGYNKQNSHSSFILRIRSGDSKLNSELLVQNIVDCGNNIKRITENKTEVKTNTDNSNNLPKTTISPAITAPNEENALKQPPEGEVKD